MKMDPTATPEQMRRDMERILTPQRSEQGEALAAHVPPTRRERIATAALQGLLASMPPRDQQTNCSNADAYASRAVRYADALLDALNKATAEALHARQR